MSIPEARTMPTVTVLERSWPISRPLDLRRTLGGLCHGAGDPVTRFAGGRFWWASRTPLGPGTLALRMAAGELVAEAWGPGAPWLLDGVPELVGEADDWSELDLSGHRLLSDIRHRLPGVRLPRTRRILDSLVPACLEQRVTGQEAFRAWRQLSRRFGEPAPGPAEFPMWLPALPSRLLEVPTWDWHRLAVDSQRQRAIRAVATVASRLEECVSMPLAEVTKRLRSVPGVGPWTAAETTVRALGDPDAVSVGDFHLANRVGWFLAGRPRSTDELMLELLEPWRGQRARVIKLIELSGYAPPKYGPRFSPNDIRRI
jgi:3-methyladenine DNA glycosylase/8-oxoguanine DNA glycosylase